MGQRQQGGQQRQRLLHGHAGPLQGLLQPGELRLWRLLPAPLHQPLEMLDHRVQGALLMIGRAAKGQACGPVALHDVVQLPHQARFANARLAAEQHHLPVPFLDLGPAPL